MVTPLSVFEKKDIGALDFGLVNKLQAPLTNFLGETTLTLGQFSARSSGKLLPTWEPL